MKVVLSQINFIWGSASTMRVTYTAVLPVRDETVDFLADLLAAERLRRGTRGQTRSLSCHEQAVLVLRWCLDGTRMSQFTSHATTTGTVGGAFTDSAATALGVSCDQLILLDGLGS
jgi:hypothetical protein